ALSGAFIAAFFSRVWRNRVAFIAGPWATSMLLLGSPSMSRDILADSSGVIKAAASIAFLGIVLLLAALIHRSSALRLNRTPAKAIGAGAGLIALAVLICQDTPAVADQSLPSSSGRPNVVLVVMDT